MNRTVLLVIISSLLFSCNKASKETEPEKKGKEQQKEPKKGDDFTGTYTWDGNAVSVAHLYLSEDSIDYYCKTGGGAGGYAPHSIIRFSGRKL